MWHSLPARIVDNVSVDELRRAKRANDLGVETCLLIYVTGKIKAGHSAENPQDFAKGVRKDMFVSVCILLFCVGVRSCVLFFSVLCVFCCFAGARRQEISAPLESGLILPQCLEEALQEIESGSFKKDDADAVPAEPEHAPPPLADRPPAPPAAPAPQSERALSLRERRQAAKRARLE